MNPHDPLKHPGAHLVYERLGIDDPFTLLGARYRHDAPRAQLAQLAANAACDLDDLHRELTDQAQTVMAQLEPIARGERPALCQADTTMLSAAGQLDQLRACKDAAYEHLTRVLDACERIGGIESQAPAIVQDRQLADAHPRSHPAPNCQRPLPARAAWDDEQGRAHAALLRLAHEDMWLREGADGDKYVIWGSGLGAPIEAETVERLIGAGLVAADTSTSASRMGHMLSLAPEGVAANSAARTERLRQVTALYRGTVPATASPAQAAPPAAAARPSFSARTR
ncbi:hypothetical protein P3T27_005891 [Kitasatospora sp. MAA19]|uniref:hypothetical protein n=1 Tax=unclassified Kitasatospora TaxID=2633591 RepID=UPI0024749504|nr:hypothetical protein [Kitasatospora sp. MAA19]MDH6709145.1 hypothetical protein [Kitasatospora sp. MAA19]